MTTPEPTPIRPLSFADRFWAHARGPETDDVPEPLRSVVIVRHFLAVLVQLDTASPRKASPTLVAMLRAAELDTDLSYASPEQVRGEILDTRSVVFSLGVVLFERLTGRHPFGAENNRPRQVDRIRKGELGSGVNSFPTVAAGLRSVLVRAMSPFPEERWPDLRQMRELLQQFITQEAPAPRLPGTPADAGGSVDEQTKVVRLATDFGRELMQVVARHDQTPSRPPSQRIAVPTAGMGAPRDPTPRRGLPALRPVPPPIPGTSPESVVTRIREPGDGLRDPDATPMEALETRRDTRREYQLVAPEELLKGQIDPHGETVVLDPHQMGHAPTAEREVPAMRSLVSPTMPAPRPLVSETGLLPEMAQPFDPSLELRARGSRRTLFIAIASAAVGAVVAVAVVLGMRDEPAPAASANRAPAPVAAAAPAAEPAAAAAAEPAAAAAAAPAAAAAAAPAAAAAAAPAAAPDSLEDNLATIVRTCLDPGDPETRVIGISLIFKTGTVQKAYFGADYSLAPRERSCIARQLRGAAAPGLVAGDTREYRVKAGPQGVTVKKR